MDLDEEDVPLGGLKRERPGICWFIWSAINNERCCLLTFYVSTFILAFATVLVLSFNSHFEIEVDGVKYYSSVMYPSFETLPAFENRGSCVVNTKIIEDAFSQEKSLNAGTISSITFLALLLVALIPAIAYASLDIQGKIIYRKMESFYRGLLFTYSTTLFTVFAVVTTIITFGLSFYQGDDSCFASVKTSLEDLNALTDTFDNPLSAMYNVDILAGVCTALCFVNILIYASLFCATRSWYETEPLRYEMGKMNFDLY